MIVAKRFVRYGGTAASAATVDWIIFLTLNFFGMPYLASQVLARVSGGIVSFFANRFWSFKAKQGRITVQGRRFLLLYLVSYCLSISLLFLQVEIFGMNLFVSKIIGDMTCFVFNFTVMNIYVFKDLAGFTERLRLLLGALRKSA